jgi:hypothetical protein
VLFRSGSRSRPKPRLALPPAPLSRGATSFDVDAERPADAARPDPEQTDPDQPPAETTQPPEPTGRPPASPPSRRPAPSARRGAAGSEAPTPLPPARATLTVQVGRAYADIYVDGVLVADLKFRARVELDEGVHTVSVVRDRDKILDRLGLDEVPEERRLPRFGGFLPRTIEVTAEGELLERRKDGVRPLADDVLLFKIPLSPSEEDQIHGWISS